MKMVISVAPLIVAQFDSKAVNAAIMQLEIEDDYAKSHEYKEVAAKEFCTHPNYAFVVDRPIQMSAMLNVSYEHDNHVQAFYPAVPTPPPNA